MLQPLQLKLRERPRSLRLGLPGAGLARRLVKAVVHTDFPPSDIQCLCYLLRYILAPLNHDESRLCKLGRTPSLARLESLSPAWLAAGRALSAATQPRLRQPALR